MKMWTVLDLHSVIPSQVMLHDITFPPVIRLHPCPCPHMFFWTWGISRLLWVPWVTRTPYPYLAYLEDVFPPFLSHKHHFPTVKVDMATAELCMSPYILFQESFKPPPVYVLKLSVCSDQNISAFVAVFCKIRAADCCWLCVGSSAQRSYISNQQVGLASHRSWNNRVATCRLSCEESQQLWCEIWKCTAMSDVLVFLASK